MAQIFANNASNTLASSITDVAATMTLHSADSFPDPGTDWYYATLVTRDLDGVESLWEIVKVTAKASDTLTIERAQEGTTASNWAADTVVEMRYTAGSVQPRVDALDEIGADLSDGDHIAVVDATDGAIKKSLLSRLWAYIQSKASGVYEPADATIIKDADIGVSVQAYDADTAKTDVAQTFTAKQTFSGTAETWTVLTGTTPSITAGSHTWTLSGNSTPTDGLVDGEGCQLHILYGSYTINWGSVLTSAYWIGGSSPGVPGSGKQLVSLWKQGGVVYGLHVGDFG